jgi:hypothetical protein
MGNLDHRRRVLSPRRVAPPFPRGRLDPERQSLGLLLSRLARLGFGQIYVSRPRPYGHRSPAEQEGRYADENECRKEIKPAHIMRPEQGPAPAWKARRQRHPAALGGME